MDDFQILCSEMKMIIQIRRLRKRTDKDPKQCKLQDLRWFPTKR